jgi:hypothetical protein
MPRPSDTGFRSLGRRWKGILNGETRGFPLKTWADPTLDAHLLSLA